MDTPNVCQNTDWMNSSYTQNWHEYSVNVTCIRKQMQKKDELANYTESWMHPKYTVVSCDTVNARPTFISRYKQLTHRHMQTERERSIGSVSNARRMESLQLHSEWQYPFKWVALRQDKRNIYEIQQRQRMARAGLPLQLLSLSFCYHNFFLWALEISKNVHILHGIHREFAVVAQ